MQNAAYNVTGVTKEDFEWRKRINKFEFERRKTSFMNDNEYRLEKPKSHLKGQTKIWIKINWIRSHLETRFYTSVIKIKYNLFRKSLVIFLFVTFFIEFENRCIFLPKSCFSRHPHFLFEAIWQLYQNDSIIIALFRFLSQNKQK